TNPVTFTKSVAVILTVPPAISILFPYTTLFRSELSIQGGGTNTGTIDADAGTTLTFAASYTHGSSSSLTGQGTLTFSGGTHTLSGTRTNNRTLNTSPTVNLHAPYTILGTLNMSG